MKPPVKLVTALPTEYLSLNLFIVIPFAELLQILIQLMDGSVMMWIKSFIQKIETVENSHKSN